MSDDGTSGQRIGLFGGTFDPPHAGHVAVATDVANALALDRLVWIPSGRPPHKPERAVTPAGLRLAMVREAASADQRFDVSTLEIERSGPSYTIDTVKAVRREHPDADLYLIVGADQVSVFDTWRDPGGIAQQVRLAVMDREGESVVAATGALPDHADVVVVPVRRVDVSSTAVRDRVRGGLDFHGLVPEGVRKIIEQERLYSGP